MDVTRILGLYALGLFPMDEPGRAELPWWAADPRTVFELDDAALEATRRKVRRSLRHADQAGWTTRVDEAFEVVLAACAAPRHEGDGVWITPRLQDVYRLLHEAGHAHSHELWADGELVAGVLAVRLGRAAMLESMFHRRAHAGNAVLVRTLERLAADGVELCDVQLPTPHLRRLGARDVGQEEYERRLQAAAGSVPAV